MSGRWRTVRTPAELAAVLAEGDYAEIVGTGEYEISDSATVRASDSATVRAYDSATVTAYDSATVTAYGSATVRASDSATVRAYGSATVTAYDSATVTAYDSATVRASDSATVRAYDSATVTAGQMVAVHQHSTRVHIGGGVLIDHTVVDLTDTAVWLDNYGIELADDGTVVLYKGVDDAYLSDHGADYTPGTTVECDDWQPTNACGNGLHLSPSPGHTWEYTNPKRYLACTVHVADIVVIGTKGYADKIKVPRILSTVEVDEHARPISAAVSA